MFNINGMLAMLGMPSLEQFVDDIMTNPNNYVVIINKITHKGKNRTFKNKVSRKRILHKKITLDTLSCTSRIREY